MAVTTEKEISQFKSRLKELARRSYEQNMFTFTPMLGLMEQTVFGEMEEELRYAGYTIFGGHDHAERVTIRASSSGVWRSLDTRRIFLLC